jgi:1,4-dihydroxy-2-naphthoyl-CoA synthase
MIRIEIRRSLMEYKQIQYKPGKVTQIIFNRPEYLNA